MVKGKKKSSSETETETWVLGDKQRKSRGNKKMQKRKKNQKRRKDELLEDEECDVPMEIWIEILLRLPFISMLGVRLVCRAWNDIITRSHHHHRNLTPAASLLHYSLSNYRPARPPRPPWSSVRRAYLVLVDLPSATGGEPSATFKDVRHPCNIHDCSIHRSRMTFRGQFNHGALIPEASCHGLVCFSGEYSHDRFFLGNPLLNEELLMVPGSKTRLKTADNDSQWKYFVGFGFSPKTNSYKIMQFLCPIYAGPEPRAFEICTICTGGVQHEESLSWRCLRSLPAQFSAESMDNNPLGSYLNGGMHWLFCDAADDSIFISRLDLDTEKFGRVQVPQLPNFKTSGKLNLKGMCLGVSDGYLNICANLCSEECDIWVMKECNFWTKQFVVKSPLTFLPLATDRIPHVAMLNYAAAEAGTRGGAVSEVMLMYDKSRLLACTTKGGYIREVELPFGGERMIVHIPSFLSIKDAARM